MLAHGPHTASTACRSPLRGQQLPPAATVVLYRRPPPAADASRGICKSLHCVLQPVPEPRSRNEHAPLNLFVGWLGFSWLGFSDTHAAAWRFLPQNFGVAFLGPIDPNGELMRVVVTTSIDPQTGETPVMTDCSSARPPVMIRPNTLTATIYNTVPGVTYNLYLYNSEKQLPMNGGFNAAAAANPPTQTWTLTATGTTITQTYVTNNAAKSFFRAVNAVSTTSTFGVSSGSATGRRHLTATTAAVTAAVSSSAPSGTHTVRVTGYSVNAHLTVAVTPSVFNPAMQAAVEQGMPFFSLIAHPTP